VGKILCNFLKFILFLKRQLLFDTPQDNRDAILVLFTVLCSFLRSFDCFLITDNFRIFSTDPQESTPNTNLDVDGLRRAWESEKLALLDAIQALKELLTQTATDSAVIKKLIPIVCQLVKLLFYSLSFFIAGPEAFIFRYYIIRRFLCAVFWL